MIGKFFCAVAALMAMPAAVAFAQDTPMDQAVEQRLGDHAKYRQVVTDFQKAVRAHDAAAAAALVSYPIDVTIGGKKTRIADAKAFAMQYDAIVTPAIAAAVQNEKYDDMMVNDQGIMLGQGEVWVNGICQDTACKTADVKVVTIQVRSDLSPSLAAEQLASVARVQPLKTFKNWVVGCDNVRDCTALGLMPDGDGGAYIRIARDGAPTAMPKVDVNIYVGGELQRPAVTLSLDGAEIPAADFTVTTGDYVTAALSPVRAADVAAKLHDAKGLKIAVTQDGKTVAEQTISLAGSAAALLYLDDMQKRVGTVTALSKAKTGDQGARPATAIPPIPVLPVVVAQRMTELEAPLPPVPAGLSKPDNESGCEAEDDLVIRLSPSLLLWGVCTQKAAYNTAYVFWVVGDGKPRPARFDLPGRKPDLDPGMLINPALSDDGMTLTAFNKVVGAGDCGDTSDWAWDGEAFKLLRYSEMTECRGVAPEDWPVLFKAGHKS